MENTKKSVKIVNMKAFRVANELSQKEVAEFLHVSIAFISAVERGQAKLPAEKLAQLLDNDQEWETAPLIEQQGQGVRNHYDHRHIGSISQNYDGDFNGPVHNNNYNGYSDEEFEKELKRRTELKDQQIASLEAEILSLRQQLNREISRSERLLGILENNGKDNGKEEDPA